LAKGATWSQFATCLEDLLTSNTLSWAKQSTTITTKEPRLLQPLKDNGNTNSSSQQEASSSNQKNPQVVAAAHSAEMEIPVVLTRYLTRKRKKKQINIETATKTKLTIPKPPPKQLPQGDNDDDDDAKEEDGLRLVKIRIASSDATTAEDGIKHCKAAKYLIHKMLRSFEEHPERFQPKEIGGGTFAEQAQAKARKERKQTSKDHPKKNVAATAVSEDQKEKAPKRRKFY
jgi:hypothetical protein